MGTSNIIATVAVFIAFLALGATLWQGYIERRHNILSVKPYLIFHGIRHPGMSLKYTIKNNGLGPAIINNFLFIVNNIEYELKTKNDVERCLNNLGINTHEYFWNFCIPEKGSSLAPNDLLIILEFKDSYKNKEFHKLLLNILPNLYIKIEYSCIYGNKYTELFH